MMTINPYSHKWPLPSGVDILDDQFTTNTISNYSVDVTSASASISGGKLNISGGVGNWGNDTVSWNDSTSPWIKGCMSSWEQEITFTVGNTPGSTTYGFALGLRSINAHGNKVDMWAWLDLSTTAASKGRIQFTYALNGTPTAMSLSSTGTRLTIANGDTIRLQVQFSNTAYAVSALQNGVNSTTLTGGYSFNTTGLPSAGNTGRFAITLLGGSQAIDYWTVKSQIQKLVNRNQLYVGDSLTYGSWQGTTSTRWTEKILIAVGTTQTGSVNAGGGDYTSEVVAKLPQLVALNPQTVIICIGGNDLGGGISSGTWQANLNSIRSGLVGRGRRIIWLYVFPRNDVDVSPVNTYLSATFTSDTIVDTYTPLKAAGTGLNATYDSGDGIHINSAGSTVVYNTITTAIPFLIS